MSKKVNLSRRILSVLLSCVMMLGMFSAVSAAEIDHAQHVIINKVYGGSTDGYASHSFIELYNPTEESVDLSNWSLQYRSSADGDNNDAWEPLNLTGTIAAKDYYLVRCAEVSDAANVAVTVPDGDQEWNLMIHNKGVSVALMNNQTVLDAAVCGDLSGARAPEGLVDLAAASGNDYKGDDVADKNYEQLAPAYEGSDFVGAEGIQSKKKAFSRTNFADTDDTAADFSMVDYSRSVEEAQLPHASASDVSENPGEEVAAFEAECLTLAPGNDTTELYVTWYADEGTTNAQVRIAGQTVNAAVTAASEGKVSCRAVVAGLTPGMQYTYQVSNDGVNWSKEYTYNGSAAGAFTFGYVGDPQLNWNRPDTVEGWKASVKAMSDAGVAFIASVGDNTDTQDGREDEYTNFFSPEELRSIPYAACVGNHDRNALFSYHFTYPNAVDFIGENPTSTKGQTAEAEIVGNYYYLYNNALFVVLNDSGYPANKEQAQVFINTFDATLKEATSKFAGKYDWLFVQHHKSTESVASHVADSDIQYYVEAGFEKLMDRYDVDFVMAGHDHVYVRSYVMKDGKRADIQGTEIKNADGTVYFTANTASGLKYYALASANPNKTEYPYLADGSIGMANYGPNNLALGVATWSQLETPGYTIVNVTKDRVTFRSFGVDDTANSIDALTVSKEQTSSSGGSSDGYHPPVVVVPPMHYFVTTTGEFNTTPYYGREAREGDIVTLKVSLTAVADARGWDYHKITVKYDVTGATQIRGDYDYYGSEEFKDGIAADFRLTSGYNMMTATVYYDGNKVDTFQPFYTTVK